MKIAVVGAYQTKFGELWEQSLLDLIRESVFGCLKDGGIETTDIQTVYIGNMLAGLTENQQHLGAMLHQVIGQPVPVTRVEAACASGGVAIHTAINAINAGMVETALVVGVEKMTDLTTHQIGKALMSAADPRENMTGLSFPGLYAMMAQAYFAQYQAKEADIAQVAVKNHHHAQYNPKAQFPFAVTQDQVMHSPKVADPLKVLDCSPITDGAAAVFLATPAWVRKHHTRNGVVITGSAMASDTLGLSQRESLTELKATKIASNNAYTQAGIETKDVDCVEVHDCFSIAEVMALEDLGMYEKGYGYQYLTKEETWLGGKRPVNTSGGLKACGHPVGATGVKQMVEITKQLRGEAGTRQVNDVKVGITHNVGGSGGTAVIHVLER